MNDFTKEELEDLLEWGNAYCIGMATIAKMYHCNLIGKIELMIDNYCEHEWDDTKNTRKYFRCSKCRITKT